ncbi:acyl-CoA thioesterase [Ruegeria halocynthiae]|uniref:acyl-CoA thioesterase n=1 Tax=Ruegeria halocynthiae TaxID=985054 RepID=UPI000567B21F|nr:acyl-CoA thioesterase [Ruegeria halocynthiae]
MPSRPGSAYEHVIRVTWGDCDPAKIAYTGRLPGFVLDAINAWWEEHLGQGWYQLELDRNIGTPFVRLEMDFKAPVTPRHRLICHVWPSNLGQSSIGFRVDGEQDGRICFSAQTLSVFVVADVFNKRAPPDDIKGLLQPFLEHAAELGT